jgi:tetratricopeptide (TPR) repeat protein
MKRIRSLRLAATRGKFAALLLTVFLVTPLCAQHSAPQHNPVQPAPLEQAEAAMDRQEWPQAEQLLRKATAANPKDARVWFDLGYVMHAEKNYPEAIAAYRKAAQLQPQSFECALNLGLMLAHEKLPEAEQVLERATTLKPSTEHANDAMARAWAALAELRVRDAKRAAEDWAKAVELSPSESNLVEYGLAREKCCADREGAERQYRRALELNPNSHGALSLLTNLYMGWRKWPESEKTLAQLLAAEPKNETAHLQLARVYNMQDKYEESAAECRKALALDPNDRDALRELGYVLEQMKQWAEAEKTYRALLLLEKEPKNAEALFGLGNSLLGQLKYKEAKETLLLCVKLNANWPEAFGQLARAAQRDKDYELAIRALDARAKLAPELPSTYFLRASCYDSLKLYKPATENYKKFLSVAGGKYPDEEFEARHRLKAIDPEERNKR